MRATSKKDSPLLMALSLQGIEVLTEPEILKLSSITKRELLQKKLAWDIDASFNVLVLNSEATTRPGYFMNNYLNYKSIMCKDTKNFYYYKIDKKHLSPESMFTPPIVKTIYNSIYKYIW